MTYRHNSSQLIDPVRRELAGCLLQEAGDNLACVIRADEHADVVDASRCVITHPG